MVSLRRLSQYLVMEERRDTVEPMNRIGLDIEGGQFYWCEPPKTKKLDSVKGAPGQGKKRSLLSVFGGLKLRKGPAVGTGPAKDSGLHPLWVCMLDLLSCLAQPRCMTCISLQSSLYSWLVVLHCTSSTCDSCLSRHKSPLYNRLNSSRLLVCCLSIGCVYNSSCCLLCHDRVELGFSLPLCSEQVPAMRILHGLQFCMEQ